MLGDLIFEAQGKLVGMKRRENGKMADELLVRGKILGEEFSDQPMFEAQFRPDGTICVEILDGELTTESGVRIRRSGIANGSRRPDGSCVMIGGACFSCPKGKFAKLNGIVLIWEGEVDHGGTYRFKGWEWK